MSTTQESDNAALSHDIPSYQEMFGDLDYIDCEHCGSIFSAAAYIVDLMRIVDQYITEPYQDSISQAGGLTLNQRRPDLAEIELTCENTNSFIHNLQIINRILEARVKTALGSEDALLSLGTITYPFTLPFHFPQEQIRSYLGHLKTKLGTIYKTFDVNELAVAREYIGLSLEDYNLITSSQTNEEELRELYGIENLDNLTNVETFLKQTGLSRTELPELLEQNLHKTELEAGLAHNFYINQVLDDNQAVQFKQITAQEADNGVIPTIENLTTATLDRIHRFIRLSKKLNWSFTDLDWVLTSINATHPQPRPGGEPTEIDEDAIKKIAKIKQLQTKYKLPLDVLCSFWHEMKTIGIGSNHEKPQDLFDRVFNNPFKKILRNKFFRIQDDSKQLELTNLNQQAEYNPILGRILAALRLNVNQLINILRAIWGEDNTVELTVENLSLLFRTSKILRLLGLNSEDYQVLLSFLGIESISSLSIDQFIQITELEEWVKSSQIKIDELDYILTGKLSSHLDIGYSESDITEGMKSLWQLAVDSLIKPSDFIGEEIDEPKSLEIFQKLLEHNYIQEVTSNYYNFAKISLDEKIAIVLNSEIKNDPELIQEIRNLINDENQLDENKLEKQIQYLLEIIHKADDKQKEELKQIASFFSIEVDLAVSLLDFASIATQTPDYVSFLLTPVQQEQEWSEIVKFFKVLSRILILTQKLELTPTELKCIADNKTAFGIDELSQLSINNIQTINRFKGLIAAFNDEKDKFVEYFASVSGNGETNHIEELAKITGWKSEQISLLVSPPENQENNQLNLVDLGRDLHKTVEGITKLKQCFNLSHHLGVNISWFTNLLNLENLPVVGESENWELYQDASQAVRQVAKAKYDDEEWVKVSEKLEGELSERKRDVLTAWILWKQNYDNLRHLSQELLIDVETSSEVSISIIKEATLAIQTYLHRCKMGLEPGVNQLDIPENWWQWMMNYRVWEANRKVFLYPENYLDPSLRKIKSPIYKELEEELLQSEITQESVEKAYQNYFEKFTEIAQLKPAGGYRCTVENNSEAQDTLYLFGRTATEPYTYYYREFINPKAKNPTWKAWDKIDLVINSEYIKATYAFHKLFIFWVEVVQTKKTKQKGNNLEFETETETKASIKYSFQKFGKQWIQPQTLAKDIIIENYEKLNENLWRKVTALPIPANDSEPEKILTLFGDLFEEDESYSTQDENQGISLTIDLLQEKTNVNLQQLPSNAFPSRLPVISNSQLEVIATDNVLYDNYADYADDSTERNLMRQRQRKGLVGYWPMNEGSGNVIHDRAGHNNGTLEGNPQWKTANDFPGNPSINVLEFDGEDDYVKIANKSYFDIITDAITISIWIKVNSFTKKWQAIITKGDDSWRLHRSGNSNKLKFTIDGIGGVESIRDINDQKWHHVVGFYDGKKLKIYIDGELDNSTTESGTIPNNNYNVMIGENDKEKGRYFHGQIAEVSIWNVALSAEQLFNNIPSIPLITKNISKSHGSVSAIENQPGWFTFDNGDEAFLAIPQKANGFTQIDNSLKAVTQNGTITLSYDTSDDPSDSSSQSELKYTFTRLTTTTIRQLSQKMFIGGLDNLLTLDSQLTPELNFHRFSPTDFVIYPHSKRLDFNGSLGIYFWEIFFHIPFLVANTLNSNQRFEEAQKWYHYIFNPTSPKELVADKPTHEGSNDRFWHYLPFRGNILQKLQEYLTNDAAIKDYNDNPFDPHAIARLRIGAYEKAIVMKYIDNLLDWGDQLFAQDNRESINQATLLYFIAYDLLGEKPENLGKRRSPSPKTFQEIKEQYQSAENIPQFLIELENRVNDTTPRAITSAPFNDLNTYFCAPENEQFIAYWERVEDRLYKIRHSMSIEGIKRQLALFQAPIDPAQLVRAVAGGRTPLSVVSQLTPAVPNYRFDYMLERAKNITSTLIQLGSSLLSALEKKDAEELALLRSSHEQSILKLITTTKEKQIEEAKETLNSLNESLESTTHRYDYYHKLNDEGWSSGEIAGVTLMSSALASQSVATGLLFASSPAYGVPTIYGLANGGFEPGAVVRSQGEAAQNIAYVLNQSSGLADRIASYQRRDQEWEFQEKLAEIDVQQIEDQIEAQKIRQAIAEQELKIHNKSIDQAKEIKDFLKDKFTNKELYQWMVARLSILYFQTYKVALDMAMATQSAYQYELNKDDTYINFDYWDSLKKGLLAGESLMLGLTQLEKAYIEGNVRRFEIEKTISMLQLNPQAFQQLKETGKCEFELSEKLFDFDFPGHYARQIKTIAVSIPAVVGPYQNIKATLTQTSNKTLLQPNVNAVEYLLAGGDNPPDESILRSNWRRNQKIAISRGAMDNGLFELNFYWDTRYLPFEGTGAVSTWELSLPKATNRIDFDTISDVIITLSYTALDGGDKFRKDVTNLEPLQRYSEAYYFNLKQAFPGEWHTFMNSNTDTNSQKLTFPISSEIIPPHIENAKLTGIILKLDAPNVSSPLDFATITLGENPIINQNDNSINESVADNWFGDWVMNFDLNKVTDDLKKDGLLNPEIVKTIELILIYEGKIDYSGF
ncbi:MAG: hypothetical protein F6J90_24090 [Moorea sp. SIOASIH]|uniref:Tc toxin subunit A-related protein n=1 Tax=Moorena sp. SIOASIH TaxID=2607817 RepID=UPI0013B9F5EE|nr:neuraminidase-like domain-containing protein [Moorena sp. SIOASIH]NEO39248.1 hypothetical protein [Moorena sp. SIOASIH]